jgi:hypothetical protein
VLLGRGDSILRKVENFGDLGGTYTWRTVSETLRPGTHDRVVILTDEQSHDTPRGLPAGLRVYTFNVAGYPVGAPSNREGFYTFGGGLTDSSFKLLHMLENYGHGSWPWD